MHAFSRTAPVSRPCVGVGVAGGAPEPFDWAVEEPDWAGGETGGCAGAPEWWIRDRPILASVPPPRQSAEVSPAPPLAGPVVPAAGRGVRLTRRGRLVVVSLVAAVLLGALWVGTRAVSAASTRVAAETTYVQNGDTLWAVAERTRPGVDPRTTVAQIRDLNRIQGTTVQPGQRLILPAR